MFFSFVPTPMNSTKGWKGTLRVLSRPSTEHEWCKPAHLHLNDAGTVAATKMTLHCYSIVKERNSEKRNTLKQWHGKLWSETVRRLAGTKLILQYNGTKERNSRYLCNGWMNPWSFWWKLNGSHQTKLMPYYLRSEGTELGCEKFMKSKQ